MCDTAPSPQKWAVYKTFKYMGHGADQKLFGHSSVVKSALVNVECIKWADAFKREFKLNSTSIVEC